MIAGDPRAIINPLIIPWWIYTPCRMRKAIHVLATGTPLPPDGCRKFLPRSIFARTHRRRSQTSNPKQRQTWNIERQTGNFRQTSNIKRQTSDVDRKTSDVEQQKSFLRRPSHQQRRKPASIFKRKSQVVN